MFYSKYISRKLLYCGVVAIGVFILASCGGDSATKPDDSRFTPVVVTQDLDEPMVFEVMKNGDVVIAERKGAIKLYMEALDTTIVIAQIPVNTKYTSAEGVVREAEEGLMGFTFDPDYEENNWVYIYYAHPSESKHVLSRWEFKDQQLVPASEVTVLEVETQREVCCHTGGGMTWDKRKNLYLTIGNNTGNVISAQTDERPGRASWDDQRGAWSTNDLRGKIIRIHPEADGSYSIPEGNLFPVGTDKTRPEIYVMGNRNPWRVSVDSKTGYIYWGEVGPDASGDSELGPRGYDELNQARGPGNFGWPFFVGPNAPFPYYDYELDSAMGFMDPQQPWNRSVNNTGLEELPPVAAPFVYYPYAASEEFPLVGSGSRSATGGPVFRKADFSSSAARVFPAYYEGKWLAADLSRGWIMSISMKANGDFDSMERFLPAYNPIEPIDIKFGPEGDLYVLEYGSTWFAKSNNSQLVKITYNSGNRIPIVEANADRLGGKVPFEVQLSSEGSVDLDGDKLAYHWRVSDQNGNVVGELKEANPSFTFTQEGVFTVTLTVTDPDGASNSKSVQVLSGNTPPKLTFDVEGNSSFFFPGKPFAYAIGLVDEEDGTLDNGGIDPRSIAVSIQYVSAGFDLAEVIQAQRSVEAGAGFSVAQALMQKGNCASCHNLDQASVGPSLIQISETYKEKPSERTRLVTKIQEGGNGVWGEVFMPANPSITANDAQTILDYIMNLTAKNEESLPPKGEFLPVLPQGDAGKGFLVLQASYTDRGKGDVPTHTVAVVKKLANPYVSVSEAIDIQDTELIVDGRLGEAVLKPRDGGAAGFAGIDMTGIKSLRLEASATVRENNSGGTIEVRESSPTGRLLGTATIAVVAQQRTPTVTMEQALQDAGGNEGEAAKIVAAAQAKMRAAMREAQELSLDLETTVNGVTDIYLVFKNDKANANQPLLTLKGLEFREARAE